MDAQELWHNGMISGIQDGIHYTHPVKATIPTVEIRRLSERRGRAIRRGLFQITECPLINTASSSLRLRSGAVRVKQIVTPRFTLASGARLTFRKHAIRDRAAGQSTELRELVAEFKPTAFVDATGFSGLVEDLDNFLLLTSLAMRRRVMCTGWLYEDEAGGLTQFYRRNLAVPHQEPINIDDCMISINQFPKYMRKVYRSFSRSNQRDLLKTAIYSAANVTGTLESRYLGIFSGIESALLHVARCNGRSGRARKLKDSFDFFQHLYDLDISDLWPLTDESGGTTLTQIRNHLIHGEYIEERSIRALSYAVDNAQWTLERVLLTILGWTVPRSLVSRSYLANFTSHEWASMRSLI